MNIRSIGGVVHVTETTTGIDVEELAQCLYKVNANAKTATKPFELYDLKKRVIRKLLDEGLAQKVGIHFSRNPRNAQQSSDLCVQVGTYYFHLRPEKKDFQELPHLGELSPNYRNKKVYMPLSRAKTLLSNYLKEN